MPVTEWGPIYFMDADGYARAPGYPAIRKPTPTPPAVRLRWTRVRAHAAADPPPTEVHPPGWLPEITPADIATMLSGTHPTLGQAVLFSSLQTGGDSVTVTTDADGGTFRAFGVGVFQAIVARCPSGKKIVFDAGTYEINQPDWGAVGAGSGAVRVPKTNTGFIGRVPPCTDMRKGSWSNIRPTTQRTTIRVKPNTAPAVNVPGAWFQCGFSGSLRREDANIHFEGTEQGFQTSGGTGVNSGPGNDGTSRRLFSNTFHWTQAANNTMRDCFSTGWFGNNGAPPGETFGFEWYHSTNGVVCRLATDGRREPGGVIYGAVGFTFGNADNCKAIDCYFHHGAHAGFVNFQAANCDTYNMVLGDVNDHSTNHVSVGRTHGNWLNHERASGSHYNTFIDCYSVGGSQVATVTHSGDDWTLTRNGVSYPLAQATIKFVDHVVTPVILGGQMGIETWVPYGSHVETIQPPNYPTVITAAGVPRPYRWKYNSAGTWTYQNQ